ncbi:hypothetical protein HDU84_008397 [Entophlyctis sp. JEL0112]|nr:hypothetical protein HDU84_008397 [Entophlyctis sp. JEL0112]
MTSSLPPSPVAHTLLSATTPRACTSNSVFSPHPFTNPSTFSHAPRSHSSALSTVSQSPVTERNFCRDLYCCGIHLHDLHQMQLHGEMFHNTDSAAARNGLAAAVELLESRRELPLPFCKRFGSVQGQTEENDYTEAWLPTKSQHHAKTDTTTFASDPVSRTPAKDPLVKVSVQDPALIAAIRFVESMRVNNVDDIRASAVYPQSPSADLKLLCGGILSPVLTLPATDDPAVDLSSPLFAIPSPDPLKAPFAFLQSGAEANLHQSIILRPNESVTPLGEIVDKDDRGPKSPVVALKDIYTDGGSVYGESDEYESTSSGKDSSSSDEDYENCDADAFAFIERQESRFQQQLDDPKRTMTPLHSKPRNLRQKHSPNYSASHSNLQTPFTIANSHGVMQFHPLTQPQLRRKRGRPRLNPHRLPATHPKFRSMLGLLESSSNSSAEYAHGPILVKLRVPQTLHSPSVLSTTISRIRSLDDPGGEDDNSKSHSDELAVPPPSPPHSPGADEQKSSNSQVVQTGVCGPLRLAQKDSTAFSVEGSADQQPVQKRGRGRPRKFTMPVLDASGEAMSYYQLQKEKKRLMMLQQANGGMMKDETAAVRAVAVAAEVAEARGRLRRNSRRSFDGAVAALGRGRNDISSGTEISLSVSISPQNSESDHELNGSLMNVDGSLCSSEDAKTDDPLLSDGVERNECADETLSILMRDEHMGIAESGKEVRTLASRSPVLLESTKVKKSTGIQRKSEGKARCKLWKIPVPIQVVDAMSESTGINLENGCWSDRQPAQSDDGGAVETSNTVEVAATVDLKTNTTKNHESEDVEIAGACRKPCEKSVCVLDKGLEPPSGDILPTESIEMHRQLHEKLQWYSAKLAKEGAGLFHGDMMEHPQAVQKSLLMSSVGLNPAVVLTTILTISVANARNQLQQQMASADSCLEREFARDLDESIAPSVPTFPTGGGNSSMAVLMMDLPYPENPPTGCRRRLRLDLLSIVPAGRRDRRFVCPSCGKDYKDANGVKYHLNKFHPEGVGIPTILYAGTVEDGIVSDEVPQRLLVDDRFDCSDGFGPSRTEAAVAANMKPTEFECFLEGCEKVFRSVNGLRYHVKNTHKALLVEAEHRNIFFDYEIPTEIVMSFGTHAGRAQISRPKSLRYGAYGSTSKLKQDGPAPAGDTQPGPAATKIPTSICSGSRKRKLGDEQDFCNVDFEEVVLEGTDTPAAPTVREGDCDVFAASSSGYGNDDSKDAAVDEVVEKDLAANVDSVRQSKRRGIASTGASASVVPEDEISKNRRRSSRVFVCR